LFTARKAKKSFSQKDKQDFVTGGKRHIDDKTAAKIHFMIQW